MKIKGIIFDFDGLILDTETAEVHIWEKVFDHFQLTFPLERYLDYIGSATDNRFVQDIMREMSLSNDQIRLALELYDHFTLTSGPFDNPREGVVNTIQTGKALNLRLAIASNSHRDWVSGHLQNLKLDHVFDPVCTRDQVSHSKPHPEIYDLVLEKWRLPPSEVIAFEDSPSGIQAAKNAGIFCIAVPNPLTQKLPLDKADRIYASFNDINLRELIENFES
ncbi:MAG TPA: HAD family phosphatase [Anaerolineaceae bacterium]|jgi:beta-phosphoglucomutase-like phosphatase (HAD superfamily)|nr:HAD family phosphatase [Anaerolineaceae bacterium]